MMGKRDEAKRILEAEELDQHQAIAVASTYAALGEKDLVIEKMEALYERKSPQLLWIYHWPTLIDSLGSDPRFQDLMSRVGHRI